MVRLLSVFVAAAIISSVSSPPASGGVTQKKNQAASVLAAAPVAQSGGFQSRTGGSVVIGHRSDNPLVNDTVHYDLQMGPNGLGYTGGGTLTVAARFTATELSAFYGIGVIKKVQFRVASGTAVTVKVWEGGSPGNPGTLVYSHALPSFSTTDWTFDTLAFPVPLVASNEYWIGYDVVHADRNRFFAGLSKGAT